VPLLARGQVPDLHFAKAGRAAADSGERCAVGRKQNGVDAIGESGQARREVTIVLPQQDSR